MANFYHPQDPRRFYRPRRTSGIESGLTVEDYEKLAAAYQELKERAEQQAKALQEQAQQLELKTTELTIKDEALQRQGADLKQTESNLLWTRAALEQAQKQMSDGKGENWQERYAQLQTEVENLRKRWEQRYTAEVQEARNRILADMLPLADHLELALHHLDGDAERLGNNLTATQRAFLETLKRYGIEPVIAQGQPFDPTRHEAIAFVTDAETPADHVVQVIQAGYVDGDRVVRPARVVVSRGSSA